MTALNRTFEMFSAHRRALHLIDARLDAERGEPPLDPADAAWLEAHLSGCADCREAEAQRRAAVSALMAEEAPRAPEGFAARVLAAAKADVAPLAEPEPEPEPAARPGRQWALGAVAAAAAVVLALAIAPAEREGPPPAVEIGGAAGAPAVESAPHFVVRAPGGGWWR